MSYKLICFDMDGVIFKDINFWVELHKKYGTIEKGLKLNKKYLHTDYNRLVKEVVINLWKGKSAKPYHDLINSLEYLPGVKETMEYVKKKNYITAIISASSIEAARKVQKEFGIDHIYANELVIKNGKISGEFIWPIGAGKEKKAKIIRDLCSDLNIPLKEVIYIGDSDTDLEAFKEVGLSIAFNSNSEALKKAATHTINSNNISHIIKYIP
ncbi:MAG: HAD family phosphatase [Candidatus Nanoarchaeia archaeon]|nr:HAD family phosphatase [Candidatus Nanoarchaeia archaeon]